MESIMKKDILNRYYWVLNVLESCQTDEQIETAQRLFENFIRLHNSDMPDSHITSFKKIFESEKKGKSISLKTKKKRGFGCNVSKFFSF